MYCGVCGYDLECGAISAEEVGRWDYVREDWGAGTERRNTI